MFQASPSATRVLLAEVVRVSVRSGTLTRISRTKSVRLSASLQALHVPWRLCLLSPKAIPSLPFRSLPMVPLSSFRSCRGMFVASSSMMIPCLPSLASYKMISLVGMWSCFKKSLLVPMSRGLSSKVDTFFSLPPVARAPVLMASCCTLGGLRASKSSRPILTRRVGWISISRLAFATSTTWCAFTLCICLTMGTMTTRISWPWMP